MTLCMMVALGHWDEFAMHVRAAFNNGLTRDDIKEVLLQAGVYCGVPAANHGFQIAQEVFDQMEK
jgi:alkylhydroperoxidase/carboxymuconolactone decarboxylase family protein YurZ